MQSLSAARLITISSFLLSLVTWGQQSESSPTTFKTNTRLVLVDVVATDSHGNFVSNLRANDFVVLEDGKPQTISSFDVYNPKISTGQISTNQNQVSTPLRAPVAVAVNKSRSAPVNIVLLDSLNTEMADQGQARKQMLQFLKALPPSQPTIIFALGLRLHLLQSLTGNTEQLVAAVDKVLLTRSNLLVSPDDKERQEAELLEMAKGGVPIAQLRQLLAESDTRALDMRVTYTCDALRQLARTVARYPGRKNLLWLSGAYPFAVKPDSQLMRPFAVQRNYAPLVLATSAALSRANIAVYPIDVRGLITTGLPASTASIVGVAEGPLMMEKRADAAVDAQATMREIAEQTGGKAFYNSNDLKSAIAHSLENGSSYYALSYVPPTGKPSGKFRSIKVQVKAKHVRLAYRRGYYAEEFESSISDAQLARELNIAVDHDSPLSTELDLKASARRDETGSLTIHYSVDHNDLKFLDDRGSPLEVKLMVAIASWNAEGQSTGHLVQKVSLPPSAATAHQIESKGISLTLKVTASDDSAPLRVGVMDVNSGRIGTTEIELRPDRESSQDRAN